ncbi:MAG: putative Ig domain-containing protein [Planctomycetota bacterium]|nr:putative Ig domain-containing protein [Planctomycetota bacterium]
MGRQVVRFRRRGKTLPGLPPNSDARSLIEPLEPRCLLVSFLAAPLMFTNGEMLPVVIGFSNDSAVDPKISSTTVKVGSGIVEHTVTLYNQTGSVALGTGGDVSISFLDGSGHPFEPDLSGTKCWYTVGYIRPEDYRSRSDINGVTRISIQVNATAIDSETHTQGPWLPSRVINTHILDSLPRWDDWYAGDTHLHSYLTNLDVFMGIQAEAGAPLRISRLLGQAEGIDWAVIADHSYALDDVEEWPLETWTGNRDYYMNPNDFRAEAFPYSWDNLETDPAFQTSFTQPLIFLKGEEITVNAPDRGWGIEDTLSAQFHLLANGFQTNDPYIYAPAWGSTKRDPDELLTDMVNRSDSTHPMFGYYAHPKADDWKYSEPMILEDVEQSRAYFDSNGRRIIRGFELWNGRGDSKLYDSFVLWEQYLRAHPDEHDWFIAGGSDEHVSDGVSFGDVRTVVLSRSQTADDILEGYRMGRSFITDGPLFAMGIDRNGDGDVSDFPSGSLAGDGLLGQLIVCDQKSEGLLTFDWPDQTSTPWGQITSENISLIHYSDIGMRGWAGYFSDSGIPILKPSLSLSAGTRTFDAFAEYEGHRDVYGDGWQCYRAVVEINGYKAFSNPIWLSFSQYPDTPKIDQLYPSDEFAIAEEGVPYGISLRFNDFNRETHTIHVDWGDGRITDVVVGTGVDVAGTTHVYGDANPDAPGKVYTITVTVRDSVYSSAPATLDVYVNNAAPKVSFDTAEGGAQYSDPLMAIRIWATDVVGEVLSASATGLPAGLTFSNIPGGDHTGDWQIAGTTTAKPGTYTIKVTVTDEHAKRTLVAFPITIRPEDAEVTYTGDLVVPIISPAVTSIAVTLKASFRDWTRVMPDFDPYPGDITKATATFRIYDVSTNDLLGEFADVPVVQGASSKLYQATHDFIATIGSSGGRQYRVYVEAGGYYKATLVSAVITVGRPASPTINGDSLADTYYLLRKDDDLLVYDGASPVGSPVASYLLPMLGTLTFNTAGGNDRLMMDLSGGDPIPSGGISFVAGSGTDSLMFLGTDDSDALSFETAQVLNGSSRITCADCESYFLNSLPDSDRIDLQRVSLGDNVRVIVSPGANVVQTGEFQTVISAKLDLYDNDLVVRNGDRDAITTLIRRARNTTPLWNGFGISSSTAKADKTGMTGLGIRLLGNGNVLVKYTWDGDGNLDGVVNADDYFMIDSGYILQAKGYQNGDFNYDGVIDADDYFLIDSAYIGQSGVLAASKPEAAVSADVAVQQKAKKAEADGILSQLFSTEAVL